MEKEDMQFIYCKKKVGRREKEDMLFIYCKKKVGRREKEDKLFRYTPRVHSGDGDAATCEQRRRAGSPGNFGSLDRVRRREWE